MRWLLGFLLLRWLFGSSSAGWPASCSEPFVNRGLHVCRGCGVHYDRDYFAGGVWDACSSSSCFSADDDCDRRGFFSSSSSSVDDDPDRRRDLL